MTDSTRDYLIVEQFVADAMQARALQAAFDLEVIDTLESVESIEVLRLLSGRRCDRAGGEFLLQVLSRAGIVEQAAASVCLTPTFRRALRFRDLLTAKLKFSELIAADYFEKLPQLLQSADDFMATSRLFELFDYGRCFDVTPQNCMQAARWIHLTSMLTRYEAPVCHEHYAFSQHQRMLDVGGNSGEFALQICRREPDLTATVVDLPVVCAVGQRHLADEPEASRITFEPMNLLEDSVPQGFDLITWKSVLHDWPIEYVEQFIESSIAALPEGGTLLIFERQKWDFSNEAFPYGLLPVMLFFRSYRMADVYTELFERFGLTDIQSEVIQLEVPFILVMGRKLAIGG